MQPRQRHGRRIREPARHLVLRPAYLRPDRGAEIIVFFAMCVQCLPTPSRPRKETGSWRWPFLNFGYMTALAYVGAVATHQRGTALGL